MFTLTLNTTVPSLRTQDALTMTSPRTCSGEEFYNPVTIYKVVMRKNAFHVAPVMNGEGQRYCKVKMVFNTKKCVWGEVPLFVHIKTSILARLNLFTARSAKKAMAALDKELRLGLCLPNYPQNKEYLLKLPRSTRGGEFFAKVTQCDDGTQQRSLHLNFDFDTPSENWIRL
jgi:hypothetical protein